MEKLKQVVQEAFDVAATGYDKPAMQFFDKGAEFLIPQLKLIRVEQTFVSVTWPG